MPTSSSCWWSGHEPPHDPLVRPHPRARRDGVGRTQGRARAAGRRGGAALAHAREAQARHPLRGLKAGRRPRIARLPAATLGLALLGGCASRQAFEQGRSLIEGGKYPQGFKKVEEAVAADPNNVEYRLY